MNFVAEPNNEDTKRKKFQVFKNVFFLFLLFYSRAISVISGIAYFAMSQNTRLSCSKVLLLGDITLHKKPLFGIKKYNRGTLPRVGEVF